MRVCITYSHLLCQSNLIKINRKYSKQILLQQGINNKYNFELVTQSDSLLEKMEVKNSRKRFYLMLLLCIGLITASIITFSFYSADKMISSHKSADQVGLDSPYRYDCNEVKCTPLDEYVWRDNEDWSFNQLTTYGSLVGPVPVKIFVRDSQIVLTCTKGGSRILNFFASEYPWTPTCKVYIVNLSQFLNLEIPKFCSEYDKPKLVNRR